MTNEQQRQALRGVYPGDKWQQKVADMSSAQVTAIFMRLRKQNKV